MKKQGIPFILSSPSGGGKSSVAAKVLARDPGIALSTSHTSRPPRPGEREGREYHFVSRREFLEMKRGGDFIEWVRLHGNLYGTSRVELEKRMSRGEDILMDIDTRGAMKVKELFPDAVLIFLLPPSMAILEQRLRKRQSEAEDELRRRLREATREIRASARYEYLIVNRSLSRAAMELEAVITAERLRASRITGQGIVKKILSSKG